MSEGEDTSTKMKELDHKAFLCRTLWKFQNCQLFTDLSIVCSDGQVSVHKTMIVDLLKLSGISLADLGESESLLLPDVSVSAVEAALKVLYLNWDCNTMIRLIYSAVIKEEEIRENSEFDETIEFDTTIDSEYQLFLDSVKKETKEFINKTSDIETKHTRESVDNRESAPKRKVGRPKGKKDSSRRDTYTFECDQCDMEFKGRLAYRKHLRIKHGLKQEKNLQEAKISTPCPYCEKVLKNGYNFNVHIALVHREKAQLHPTIVFKKNCADCEEKFLNIVDLDKHTRSVHGKPYRSFKCNFCNEKLQDKPSLRAHRLALHKDQLAESGLTGFVKNISCPYCDKMYKIQSDVNRHIVAAHKDKLSMHPEIKLRHSCAQCQENFFEKQNLLAHNAVYHGDEFQCEFCDKSFKHKGSLFTHVESTHKNEQHLCEECSKVFKTKHDLRHHMKKIHSSEPFFKYPCIHCKQGAQTEEGLNNHVEKNHKGKQHMCSVCSAMFHDNQARSLHERRMHSEKTLSCDQCDKKFSLPHILTSHIKNIHIKKRDKICPICGEDFFDLVTYKCHVNRHNDIRPFACETCGQCYHTSRDLKSHMKVHTLPYKCTICEKSFSAKCILDDHIRKHAGEKLGCRFGCGGSYLDRRNRDRHEKSCVENQMKGTTWKKP